MASRGNHGRSLRQPSGEAGDVLEAVGELGDLAHEPVQQRVLRIHPLAKLIDDGNERSRDQRR